MNVKVYVGTFLANDEQHIRTKFKNEFKSVSLIRYSFIHSKDCKCLNYIVLLIYFAYNVLY